MNKNEVIKILRECLKAIGKIECKYPEEYYIQGRAGRIVADKIVEVRDGKVLHGGDQR